MQTRQTRRRARAILLSLAATAALGSVGCATRGYEHAAATSGSLQEAATELGATRQQITHATTTLERMIERPSQDLRPLYADYERSVDSLESSVATLERRSVELTASKRRYLDSWSQNSAGIQGVQIHQHSLDRQREVAKQFDDAQSAYGEARDRLAPLLQDLRDVRRLLGADLTAAGIDAADDALPRIRDRAREARDALNKLETDFQRVRTSLGPTTLNRAS